MQDIQQHSDLCDEVELEERCIECIDDFYDGQIQAAEDRFRYDD